MKFLLAFCLIVPALVHAEPSSNAKASGCYIDSSVPALCRIEKFIEVDKKKSVVVCAGHEKSIPCVTVSAKNCHLSYAAGNVQKDYRNHIESANAKFRDGKLKEVSVNCSAGAECKYKAILKTVYPEDVVATDATTLKDLATEYKPTTLVAAGDPAHPPYVLAMAVAQACAKLEVQVQQNKTHSTSGPTGTPTQQ